MAWNNVQDNKLRHSKLWLILPKSNTFEFANLCNHGRIIERKCRPGVKIMQKNGDWGENEAPLPIISFRLELLIRTPEATSGQGESPFYVTFRGKIKF